LQCKDENGDYMARTELGSREDKPAEIRFRFELLLIVSRDRGV